MKKLIITLIFLHAFILAFSQSFLLKGVVTSTDGETLIGVSIIKVGTSVGTITNIEIAPLVGVWLLPRVAVAAGPEYRYYAQKHFGGTNIFGGRAYTQLVLIQDINNIIPAGLHLGLFLHAEDELLNLESKTPFWVNNQVTTDRFNINTFLVGGGVSQPMGRRSALNIIALWALNDPYGLYRSPDIRVSFTF